MLPRPLVILSAGVLAACGVVPERPQPPAFDEQSTFSVAYDTTDTPPAADTAWWSSALPAALAADLVQVMQGSPALHRAAAEVDAARAALRQATAAMGPNLSAEADIGVQKTSEQRRSDSRSAGLDAAVPLDASGALESRKRAAQLALLAADADLLRQRAELARDLTVAAIDTAEASQRRVLLDRQTKLTAKLLRLIELRFTQGLASGVDVLQQRDQLAALRQQLPVANLDAQRARNQLRGLAGVTPGKPALLELTQLPQVTARFVAVQPVDLLQRRPALRAANARLQAADARFAAALADRWPEFRLSAGALTRTLSGDVTTVVSAALDATLTLFDSGNKIAIAEQRRAELAAAGHQLLDDWVNAVVDADTLMHEERSLRRRIELSEQRLATAQALLKATQRRYERGVSDYLPVLEALRGLQQQQRDHLALQADLSRTRVHLHFSLGMASGEDKV